MIKDNKQLEGVDVQVISVPSGSQSAPITIPAASQLGNGVVVMPLSQVAAAPQAAAPAQPAVILITMGPKKDESEDEKRRKEKAEKEKHTSSVYQRL